AAHCIPKGKRRVTIQTSAGKRYTARLDRIDRDADLAVLKLDRPLALAPLRLSPEVVSPGDSLLFVGRLDRGGEAQLASVRKVGRCPSLPRVPNAVFTTIDARPGDSGAPILDTGLGVVGLVHGGARCHIAAPV